MVLSDIRENLKFQEKMERKYNAPEKQEEDKGSDIFNNGFILIKSNENSGEVSDFDVLINRIIVLKEFLKYQKALKHTSRTIEIYARHIIFLYQWKSKSNSNFFRICPIEEFSWEDLDNYVLYLRDKRHYKLNTLRSAINILRLYFEFAKTSDFITKNTFSEVPPQKRVEWFNEKVRAKKSEPVNITLKDFDRMVEAAPSYCEIALLYFMLSTGATISEIESVQLEDIDWKKSQIHFIKCAFNRGGRTVSIPVSTLAILRKYVDEHRGEPNYPKEHALFLNNDRMPLNRRLITGRVQKCRKLAKIKGQVTSRSIRGLCARILWGEGWSIEAIMEHLGLTSLSSTVKLLNVRRFEPESKK